MPSSQSIHYARILVFISLAGLVLSLSLDNFTSDAFSVIRWLVQVLPLLLFIPALMKNTIRPYQWLCFVILLYFLLGVLYLFTPERNITGGVISFFCVLLFCSAIFYIQQRQKESMR